MTLNLSALIGLSWYLVFGKKGIAEETIARFTNIYEEGIPIPMIDIIPGKPVSDKEIGLVESGFVSELILSFPT